MLNYFAHRATVACQEVWHSKPGPVASFYDHCSLRTGWVTTSWTYVLFETASQRSSVRRGGESPDIVGTGRSSVIVKPGWSQASDSSGESPRTIGCQWPKRTSEHRRYVRAFDPLITGPCPHNLMVERITGDRFLDPPSQHSLPDAISGCADRAFPGAPCVPRGARLVPRVTGAQATCPNGYAAAWPSSGPLVPQHP